MELLEPGKNRFWAEFFSDPEKDCSEPKYHQEYSSGDRQVQYEEIRLCRPSL